MNWVSCFIETTCLLLGIKRQLVSFFRDLSEEEGIAAFFQGGQNRYRFS